MYSGVHPNLQLVNSGTFTHRGIEAAGHYKFPEDPRIIASYSYIDPGNQSYSTPKQKLFVRINYTYRRADINLTLEHIADLYGADNSQEWLPNYTIVGMHISYAPAKLVQFYVTIDNSMNVSYQTIYGYPMPGRTLFAGLNLRMGSGE